MSESLFKAKSVILRNSTISLVARAVSAVLSLATIPMMLQALGKSDFGLFSVIIALGSLTVFLDQGLAVQLRTAMAEFSDKDGSRDEVFIQGMAFLFKTSFRVGLLGSVVLLVLPWAELLKLNGQYMNWLAAGFFFVNTICLSLSGVLRALEGSGKFGVVAIVPIFSSMWMLAAAWVGMEFELPLWFFLFASSTNLVPAAIFGSRYLGLHRLRVPKLKQKPSRLAGGSYFSLALVATFSALTANIGYFVVSNRFGTESVAEYSVGARVVSVVIILISASSPILWTMFIRARTRGESLKRSQSIKIGLLLTVTSIALSAASILVGPPVLSNWLGFSKGSLTEIFISLCLPIPVLAGQLVPGNAQNDAPGLKFQSLTLALSCVASFTLASFLAAPLGIIGVGLGIAIGQITFHLIPIWLRWHLESKD